MSGQFSTLITSTDTYNTLLFYLFKISINRLVNIHLFISLYQTSSGATPFSLVYGRDPFVPTSLNFYQPVYAGDVD